MTDEESNSQDDPAVAMVATSSAKLPKAAGIVSACEGKTPMIPRLFGPFFGTKSNAGFIHDWEGKDLVFPHCGTQVAVSLMPAPIPWSQLEGPCATSMHWSDATKKLKEHTNHFLIAVIGGSIDPIERRLLLTRLVSAVASTSDSVGIYWAEGALVHEPKKFIELARSARKTNIPGPLWIDVRVELNSDDSYRCFTTGMRSLGYLEIEVQKSQLPPSELMTFIGDTACYIVNTRQHIPDGNTMGRTATEQYTVHHGPSMFDRPYVMQLVMQ